MMKRTKKISSLYKKILKKVNQTACKYTFCFFICLFEVSFIKRPNPIQDVYERKRDFT